MGGGEEMMEMEQRWKRTLWPKSQCHLSVYENWALHGNILKHLRHNRNILLFSFVV